MSVAIGQTVESQIASNNFGAIPNAATDAYITFNGPVNMVGGIRLSTVSSYILLTLSGLDPTKTYTFATSGNRNYASYTNQTIFKIEDIANSTMANESTSGVNISTTVIPNDTSRFAVGYNTVNGYVTRWTGIQPGDDGDFAIRFTVSAPGTYAYGPSVFLLSEELTATEPTIYTTGALSAFTTPVGTPSEVQSYTVSAVNLVDDLVISAPADFEISTAGDGPFASTLNIPPNSGAVASTPIYLRFSPTSGGDASGNISHASSGALTVDRAVSGTATAPTIILSGSTTPFSSAADVASTVQRYRVAGSYLTGDITLTAPADFEISTTSSSGFSSSLTLSPVDGTLAATNIYVRLVRPTAGTSTGSILHESSGAVSQSIPVSGTAYAWRAYNDCYVSGIYTNPANTTTVTCSTNGASGALKNFDTGASLPVQVAISASTVLPATTGAIPADATDAYNTFFGTASIIGNLRLSNSAAYGTLTFTGLDAGKTYTFVTTGDRSNSGVTMSAAFTIMDVDNTEMINASTAGVAVSAVTIEGDTSTFNTAYNTLNGYVARWTGIQPGADGDFQVRYSPTADEAYGPSVYMLAEEPNTTPLIQVSGTVTAFSSQPGTASSAQTYTISGSRLADAIHINAPAGFELSSDGSTYTSSLTLEPTGGEVAATTLYVRLNSATAGSFSGNITHASAGAGTVHLPVSGTVVPVFTLVAATTGSGTVALSPAGGSYSQGTTVTLTPMPDPGNTFAGWTGTNAGDLVDHGDGSWSIVMTGNFSVIANFTSLGSSEHQILLAVGWNLVSFRLHPDSTAIQDVLASVEGNYDLVYAWDATGAHSATSGNWLKWDNLPLSADTLTSLDENTGFWIHMTSADTLVVTGIQPSAPAISLSDAAGGWNLVGYPAANTGNLPEVLSEHNAGAFSLVYSYQVAETDDLWKLFDRSGPDYANDLTGLSAGLGYWVMVDMDAVWNVPVSNP